jgi:hypothetical protein
MLWWEWPIGDCRMHRRSLSRIVVVVYDGYEYEYLAHWVDNCRSTSAPDDDNDLGGDDWYAARIIKRYDIKQK